MGHKHMLEKQYHPLHHFWSPFQSVFDLLEDPKASHTNNISLSEDDDHVYIEAPLPGVRAEELEINLNKGVIWIKGERTQEETDKKKRYYSKTQSSFSYRVSLPESVPDDVKPDAELKNGILYISCTKAKEEQPRTIQVRSQ